ncbi:MAG: T9SS type A sorting domain-containing protein [Saprospiraceae bacterium]|nr:T9SS type A sorting domain-containing protein [Saprospiraceae bacterium]
MKQKKLQLSVLLLGLGLAAQAQQVVTATGGDASGSGGTVAYSVGQVVYATNTANSISVAQGVQQPYEISIVTGIEDHPLGLGLLVYPNPTADYLILDVGDLELLNLEFQLFDIDGKLIVDQKIANTNETIPMENLPGAVYFLKVLKSNTALKTFKIIKV